MNVKFWPSLKDIAKVRIAKGILYSCNLHIAAARGDLKLECPPGMVSEIAKHFLRHDIPPEIQIGVFGIVGLLGLEIFKWHSSHNGILLNNHNNYCNSICWYSHGIINRLATVKILVQDENIDISRRLVLACMYYLENDALALWEELSITNRLSLLQLHLLHGGMAFWINKFLKGDIINVTQMLEDTKVPKEFHQIYLGFRGYFKELGLKAKYRCLSYGLKGGNIHHFDLYLCLSEMNHRDVVNLFAQLSEINRLRMMVLFLSWPLQSTFVEMFYKLWSFSSEDKFRDIYDFIVREIIGKHWQDANYAKLVRYLEKVSSYRNRLKRVEIYKDKSVAVKSGDRSPTNYLLRRVEGLQCNSRETTRNLSLRPCIFLFY